jgi:ribosomal protein S18 acetylase RimI-like enzyme
MDPRHHRALDRRAEAAQFALERPDSADAAELIGELEAHLASRYPAESRHGYSVEKLLREGVAFFVARVGREAAGCGGVQIYGKEYAELKRMYIRPRWRRLGLGKQMLDCLAAHARRHGVEWLRLETGIHQAEAIGLYEGYGFRRRPPFGLYREDPLSLYYEKCIAD